MKHITRLLTTCVMMSWLIACADAPVSPEPPPTATARTIAPSTATSLQNEASSTKKIFEVSDAKFILRSIAVESAFVAAADFNGDGQQDLVNGGEPQLTILLGDGKGGLTSFSQVPGGEQPNDFALTDLDQDGDIDIVVANHDTDYLSILLGDGHGIFQPAPSSPLRINVLPHPHAVRAADLNTDGLVDLVVDNRQAEGLLILTGLGKGLFESPGTLVGVGGDPYRGMAIGDINGDGKLDLVTPNPREVGVLLNASNKQMEFIQASPVEAKAPFAVEVGDFNGDDRLDLIAASDEGSPLVELFLGDGRGGFKQADDSPFHLAPGGKNIAVGDFNGDGIEDAAIASYQFPDVQMLLGGRGSIRSGFLPGGEHPWGLAVADLNGDGKDDLVIVDDTSPNAKVYLSLEP